MVEASAFNSFVDMFIRFTYKGVYFTLLGKRKFIQNKFWRIDICKSSFSSHIHFDKVSQLHNTSLQLGFESFQVLLGRMLGPLGLAATI